MGKFGFKSNENLVGASKQKLRRFYFYVNGEGDNTNIKARVQGTDTNNSAYNFGASISEVDSIEKSDDGTYFALNAAGTVLTIKAAALVANQQAIWATDIINTIADSKNYTVQIITDGSGGFYVSLVTDGSLTDLTSLASDKGFAGYVTYLSAA